MEPVAPQTYILLSGEGGDQRTSPVIPQNKKKIKKSPVLNHGEDLVPNPDKPLPVMWWIAITQMKQFKEASRNNQKNF